MTDLNNNIRDENNNKLKGNHKHILPLHCLNLKHFACIPITAL